MTLGEAITALERGKRVEYQNGSGVWFPFLLGNTRSVDCLRECYEFRLAEPEQTEAEKFLEKWKGKRITKRHLADKPHWIMPEKAGNCKVSGPTDDGSTGHIFRSDFKCDWQEWCPPTRTAREWLTDLPEHIQAELPEEGHKAWQSPDDVVASLTDALRHSFFWSRTGHSHDFWPSVHKATQGKQPYPRKVTRTVTPAELAGKWVVMPDGFHNSVLGFGADKVIVGLRSFRIDELPDRFKGYADTPNGELKPFTVTEWDLCPEEPTND